MQITQPYLLRCILKSNLKSNFLKPTVLCVQSARKIVGFRKLARVVDRK